MIRRTVAALVALTLVVAVTGCVRYDANYYLRKDWTVDGSITTAIKKDYATESDPYKGTGAGDIRDSFSTIEEFNDLSSGDWYTYEILFLDEPMDNFMADPEQPWQVRIGFDGLGQQIFGYDSDNYNEETRQTIRDEGGWVNLTVYFPNELSDPGNLTDRTPVGSGEAAYWNLLEMSGAPFAASFAGEPDPEEPEPAPEPEPEPEPSPSPSASASSAPTLQPEPSAAAGAGGEGAGGVPVWVWIVLGLLAAGLAALVGILIATRGKPDAALDASPDEA